MSTQVFLRDSSLRRTAQLEDFVNLTLVLRFAGVSSWTLVNRGPAIVTDGIVVVRDGVTLLSGPVTSDRRESRPDAVTQTLAGQDDTVWLRRTLALPVPSGPPYTAAEYDDRSGSAETVMRGYVDANLGPSASPARRLPGLTMPADQGRGGNVRGRARFTVLLELLQSLALAGGDIGFRIIQTGPGALQFQPVIPADRTGTAVFSSEVGNLSGYDYSRSDSDADYVIVAGQGEGTLRTFVEGGDTAAIANRARRSETFVDRRDTNDTAVLTQVRDERLMEQKARTSLSITPIDTAAVRYGVDYLLGDRVSVVVDGVRITDVVREVTLTLDAGQGERLMPVVGTPGASSPAVPDLFERMARQSRRVSTLERR